MFENRKIDWEKQQSEKGHYSCSHCGEILFDPDKKFDSKTGFPSFYAHVADHVQQQPLSTYGRERIQLLCHRCGQHLGHLFQDQRTPSKVRYCINGDAIALTPAKDL